MSSDVLQQLVAAAASLDDPGRKGASPLKPDAQQQPGASSLGPGRVLLVTTVDIGGGASERIEVRAGEDPTAVAAAFCVTHGLPDAIVGPLAAHLGEHLRKAAGAAKQQGAASEGSKQSPDGRVSPPRSGGGPSPPHAAESPKQPAPAAPAAQAQQQASKPQYSFGSGMDDRLYEQLSSKLMDETQAPANRNRGNWVSASEMLNSSANGNGSVHSNGKRSSSGVSANGGGPYPYAGKAAGAAPGPSPRDSVHLRLYATAQERSARHEERRRLAEAEAVASAAAGRASLSWISAEMMRGRGAGGSYDNYGEMLYAEGVETLMARLKRGESERKARAERELDGVTFAPAITKKAWELKQRERGALAAVVGLGGGSVDGSVGGEDDEKWARLHARGMRKATLERLEALRAAREAAEVAECTFRPRINRNSEALMTERGETLKALSISHHEQLFADALRRQSKLEELQRWYPDGVTFQPAVNKDARAKEYLRRSWERSSKQQQQQGSAGAPGAAAQQGASSPAAPPQSVVERLYAEAERKQAKLEAARAVLHGPIDPVTNKPLFQPETGRGPRGGLAHTRGSGRGGSIGEHLYRSAQDAAARRAAAEEAERRAAEEEASRSRTTAVSQRLFTELKLKRFRQIYDYLDSDASGQLDLLAVLGRAPPAGAAPGAALVRSGRADNLDAEVLLDVEAAADVWARANGLAPTPEAPQPPAGSEPASPRAAAPPPPSGPLSGPCPPLSLEMFMSVMEEALALRRGPRAYLVPSPSAKAAPAHSFRPAINPRSRALAAKSRPDSGACYELLHRVAAANAEKLEALRRAKEEAGLAGCTFRPQLNANRNALGRAASSGRGPQQSQQQQQLPNSGAARGAADSTGFAAAAAGIEAAAAAGADGARSPGAAAAAAAAEAADLRERLAHLRLAADTAADVRAALEAGGEEGEGEDEEELARFSLLEAELRDMQALTQVAIDDQQRQQAAMAALAAAAQDAPVARGAAGSTGGAAGAAGGLQELAAVLGVGSWNAGAATDAA